MKLFQYLAHYYTRVFFSLFICPFAISWTKKKSNVKAMTASGVQRVKGDQLLQSEMAKFEPPVNPNPLIYEKIGKMITFPIPPSVQNFVKYVQGSKNPQNVNFRTAGKGILSQITGCATNTVVRVTTDQPF